MVVIDNEDRQTVFEKLGGRGDVGPKGVVELHYRLLGLDPVMQSPLASVHFDLESARFWLVWSSSKGLNDEVNLAGHRLSEPEEKMQELFLDALLLAQQLPDEMEVIARFSPCFGYLKLVEDKEKPITSCSLPDFPMISFFSEVATRHIPPTSVLESGSKVLLAENLFHESVHQMVNFSILTNGLLRKDFDSSTSPMVDIPWRVDANGRATQWQVDRVLHAASVYTKLLGWRHKILQITDDSLASDLIVEANNQAVTSASKLLKALNTHRGVLSERGSEYLGDLETEFDSHKRNLSS